MKVVSIIVPVYKVEKYLRPLTAFLHRLLQTLN